MNNSSEHCACFLQEVVERLILTDVSEETLVSVETILHAAVTADGSTKLNYTVTTSLEALWKKL